MVVINGTTESIKEIKITDLVFRQHVGTYTKSSSTEKHYNIY